MTKSKLQTERDGCQQKTTATNKQFSRVGLIALAAGLAACAHAEEEVGCAGQTVWGGADTPGIAELNGEISGLAGLVISFGPISDEREFCSGALLADGRILTAKHCVSHSPSGIQATFGPQLGELAMPANECRLPVALHPARVAALHPTEDLALVALEDRTAAPLDRALTIASELPTVGSEAWLGGYGLSQEGIGLRRFLKTLVTAVDGSVISVDTDGDNGPCSGDSGGPLLVEHGSPGTWRVAGILGRGSSLCVGPDNYVSVVAREEWLAPEQ